MLEGSINKVCNCNPLNTNYVPICLVKRDVTWTSGMIILSIYKVDVSWWFETRRGSGEDNKNLWISGGRARGFSLVN
jgi:hypothetical protein